MRFSVGTSSKIEMFWYEIVEIRKRIGYEVTELQKNLDFVLWFKVCCFIYLLLLSKILLVMNVIELI